MEQTYTRNTIEIRLVGFALAYVAYSAKAHDRNIVTFPIKGFSGPNTLHPESFSILLFSNRKSCLLEALQHGVDLEAAFDAYWPLPYLHSA